MEFITYPFIAFIAFIAFLYLYGIWCWWANTKIRADEVRRCQKNRRREEIEHPHRFKTLGEI